MIVKPTPNYKNIDLKQMFGLILTKITQYL